MEVGLLSALSNADALAGDEEEVRNIIREVFKGLDYVEKTDGLGSIVYSTNHQNAKYSVMFCAHMDEVGFMVRTIDDLGLIHLMKVGGVQVYGQCYQHVRVTTRDRLKIPGLTFAQYKNEAVERVCCDVGASSKEEVENLGISIGDMVTFDTEFKAYSAKNIYAGKAMDNRLACYILCQLAKKFSEETLPINVHFAFTSSEEVGIRGAKTATQLINPDIVYVIDVATAPSQLIRDHTNKRQMGKGPLVTLFDRTLSPNRKMANHFRDLAKSLSIPLQVDMFNTGGTDGGEAHKVNEGKPTLVTILPVRYGHCTASLVNCNDIQLMEDLYSELLRRTTPDLIENFRTF